MRQEPPPWGKTKGHGQILCTHVTMSEFISEDTRHVGARTMSGNGSVKQIEKPPVLESLDDLLKFLRSETGEGQILNSSSRVSAYPSSEAGYSGSGSRQDLPTTAEIIKFFKDLPSSSPGPESADDPKKLNTTNSLKEVYFPAKRGVDSSSVQQNQGQSSSLFQPLVPSQARRVNVLPEKDLSLLDSGSLLKNLDAALADITRSAGKSDYSITTVPESKEDRKCLQIDSSLESSPLSSKFLVSVNPLRTAKAESSDQFSSFGDKSLRAANCDGHPITFSCSLDSVADNPSMLITPLRRTQGERVKIPEMGSSVSGTQSNGSFSSHLYHRGSSLSVSQSPVLSSGVHLSEAGTCEMAYETNLTKKFKASRPAIANNSSSSLRSEPSKPSGLNPLLSSEKLGRWMDGLAGSSHVTYRGTQEDWKSHKAETSSSGREETNTARTTVETWWESKDQIPSYLSAKPIGALLPDCGRIWTEADDYSDPPKKPPSVTSPKSKSDFSCNSQISLASPTRTPTSDFSCTPAISLASSTRMSSINLSVISLVSSSPIT